jgi:hypothetical protein
MPIRWISAFAEQCLGCCPMGIAITDVGDVFKDWHDAFKGKES